MESSLIVAAASQRNLQNQLVTVANNIANMNTVGYRAEVVDFNALISRTDEADVHFPTVAKLYPSTEQGTHLQTDNPLDVAISGDGYFAINTPAGIAYTRDGRMQINPLGELQTLEGFSVLDSGQAPIQFDPGAGAPEIGPDGRVLVNGRSVASLGVFDLPQTAIASRYTNSSFLSNTIGIPIILGQDTSLSQGFVENSNVNPMKEMTNLIAISKNYQSASTLISRVDQAVAKAIDELGRR